MNIYELFRDSRFQLPIIPETEKDFSSHVTSFLDNYIFCISELDDACLDHAVSSKFNDIESFCELSLSSLRLSLDGNTYEAFAKFSEAMSLIKDSVIYQLRELGDVGLFYRARVCPTQLYKRSDIFHVPFHDRRRINTQRYSIPGLPCLYLSGSIYTCWEELGRPHFHEIYASAFSAKRPLKVLNFTNRPARIQKELLPKPPFFPPNLDSKTLGQAIIAWPLMALCSIRVKCRELPFKPEYIFPQMLLQWVRSNNDVDGICYFSVNTNETSKDSPFMFSNLVFPVKKSEPSGFCTDLSKSFELTRPYNWQILRSVSLVPTNSTNHGRISLDLPQTENYPGTEFGQIERAIDAIAERDGLKPVSYLELYS